MTEVGIRALKAQLSAYLKRVQTGVRVTITDRGHAVATLEPIKALKICVGPTNGCRRPSEVERREADRPPSQSPIEGHAHIAHGHRGPPVTLYLDTSNMVKRYIDEDDSDEIERLVSLADMVATSMVAYAEARAVFARRRREGLLTSAAYATVKRQFDLDWPAFFSIEVSEAVARSAGALADRLKLRGFDAIHLASFELLLGRVEDDEVRFSSADIQLTRAAKRLG